MTLEDRIYNLLHNSFIYDWLKIHYSDIANFSPDDPELNNWVIRKSDNEIRKLAKMFAEALQTEEVVAKGIVTIERDLSSQTRILDFYLMENRKPISIFDLFTTLEGKRVKIILEE